MRHRMRVSGIPAFVRVLHASSAREMRLSLAARGPAFGALMSGAASGSCAGRASSWWLGSRESLCFHAIVLHAWCVLDWDLHIVRGRVRPHAFILQGNG